jgi:hypothetical protein
MVRRLAKSSEGGTRNVAEEAEGDGDELTEEGGEVLTQVTGPFATTTN